MAVVLVDVGLSIPEEISSSSQVFRLNAGIRELNVKISANLSVVCQVPFGLVYTGNMRLLLVLCCLIASLSLSLADDRTRSKKSNVTKLEPVDFGEVHADAESKPKEAQRKRDSGYSYNRPDRVTSGHGYNPHRFAANQSGYRGRIVSRYPSHTNRPFNTYGPPSQQNSPFTKPSNQFSSHNHQQYDQRYREPIQHHHQGHSSNQNNGLLTQEVPSPIRNADFVEPSPIASQNNEPFSSNTANYLPPRNQKLPAYSVPDTFAPQQQGFQGQSQLTTDFQSQSLVQGQGQDQSQGISDAAQFLAQNAQAISQLYGAPATDQSYAPNNNNNEFQNGHDNQIQSQNSQFEHFQSNTDQSRQFQGALPSYASGTLSVHESLEQIQSMEKDRLIAQLQQALLSQSQSQSNQFVGQYAQNHGNYLQNQNLMTTEFSSADKSSKFNGQNLQNPNVLTGSFGIPSTALGQQGTFVPGPNPSSGFTLSYGLTSTTQAPITPSTTTTRLPPIQPAQSPSGIGSTQVGTSLPAPPPTFPHYGGFVPTLIGGTNFVANVPSYGPGFLGSGSTTTSVHPAETSPTHFGLPIPSNQGHAPAAPPRPHPPPSIGFPTSPPVHSISVPVQPVQPVHPIAAPAPPVASPIQPVGTAPFQPFLPANPVVTQLHPVQTPVATPGQPTYGIQPAVFNPLLYKPVKAVYPVYYYPNLNYQLQKPSLSTYPWSYAPSYPQAKPAYNWK